MWNEKNYYQQIDGKQIISFWTIYNKQLLELIKLVPKEKLTNTVETGETGKNNIMTIASLIDDYVEHLEHHLSQVITYKLSNS